MKKMIMYLSLFFSFAHAANSDWEANKKCIRAIDQFEVLPSGYALVALKDGGIIQIYPGADGTIFVTDGRKEAASRDMYPFHKIRLNGTCVSSREGGNGTNDLGVHLAKLLANPTDSNKKQSYELIEACKDAPAFSEVIARTKKYRKAERTAEEK